MDTIADVLTVTVEAVGSGVVIIPALDLRPEWTINEVKESIYQNKKYIEGDPIYPQSYRLFIGHGGAELTDPCQLVMDSIISNNCIIVVVIYERKNAILKGIYLNQNRNVVHIFTFTEWRDDYDVVLVSVKRAGHLLSQASEKLRANKNIVLAAVTQCGNVLQYASEDLRNDKDVVLTAIKYGGLLQHASEELRNDRDVVMLAIKYNSADVMVYMSANLRDDKDIIFALMDSFYYMSALLQYASPRLRNDKSVVMTSVITNPKNFRDASDMMRADKDIVIRVLSWRGMSELPFVHSDAYSDKEIVLEIVRRQPTALKKASAELRNDRDIVMTAVMLDASVICYASDILLNDKDFVSNVVKLDGSMIRYASDNLRNDKDLVLIAAQQNVKALKFVSDDMRATIQEILDTQNNNTICCGLDSMFDGSW